METAPYLIKPNQKELEYLVGRKIKSREELIEEANKLLQKGIQKVLISLGAKGLLYVDKEGWLLQPAYSVDVLNTVACGDTVVASYCMSELEQKERESALKCATALSAANATTEESAQIPMEVYQKLVEE